MRTNRLRTLLIAAVLVVSLLPTTSAFASHTPQSDVGDGRRLAPGRGGLPS